MKGYQRANWDDDVKRGIDGWVETDVGKIPLQIKASKPRKLYFKNGGRVVIPVGLNDEEILARCMKAVQPIREQYLTERGWK